MSRREFLHVMAASLALAGLAGCAPRDPAEKIVPYVKAPEGFIPGKPLYYASTLLDGGAATGVLVESHMGRPTKIEGNDRHPASLGATSAVMQASILTMYDPDRSQVVTNLEEVRPWTSFVQAMTQALAAQKAVGGKGLRILTETVNSPTMADQLNRVLAAYPRARWHQYEPINQDNAVDGARMAFGEVVDTHFNLAEARVIVSLDRDFLFEGPGHLRYVRDFARGRRISSPGGAGHGTAPPAGHEASPGTMSRLYVAESGFTNTGARADHRLAVSPDLIESIAREIARQVGVSGVGAGSGLDA
ncbi:MAG: molybdopterin oxidoreductase, iron-sulfur binding subunit, partial [bacterium]